jgi:hypothetical protein
MGLPHTWAYLNFLHLYCWEKSVEFAIESKEDRIRFLRKI